MKNAVPFITETSNSLYEQVIEFFFSSQLICKKKTIHSEIKHPYCALLEKAMVKRNGFKCKLFDINVFLTELLCKEMSHANIQFRPVNVHVCGDQETCSQWVRMMTPQLNPPAAFNLSKN